MSTGEFAAIRAVGFEPVGQVMGAMAFQVARGGENYMATECGYLGGTPGPQVRVSGQYGGSAELVKALLTAQRQAIGRMTGECLTLGGDGVVAAALTTTQFPKDPSCLEITVVGTAVRALGAVRPARPFTSHLNGQDFAKLLLAGWVPVKLLIAMSIGVRHDDWATRRQRWLFAGNQEVTGWSELINATRHDARDMLSEQARKAGADGVVLARDSLRIRREKCVYQEKYLDEFWTGKDHIAEVTLLGSSVTPIHVHNKESRHKPRGKTLTVLPLDT